MTSRLKSWNLVDDEVRVTKQRKRHDSFAEFFSTSDDLTYCHDIFGLFDAMDVDYRPCEWRFFIDSSKSSLKGVLLHNGNVLPSLPIAYAAHLAENYENVKTMLSFVNYEVHNWLVIGDFKIIGFLTGLQSGYTKHVLFVLMGQPHRRRPFPEENLARSKRTDHRGEDYRK